MNEEEKRLAESRVRRKHWKRRRIYLRARAWKRVREDYSDSGAAREHLPLDRAHRKAYRWNEDGTPEFPVRHQLVCFA
jgi:hypothetical protein